MLMLNFDYWNIKQIDIEDLNTLYVNVELKADATNENKQEDLNTLYVNVEPSLCRSDLSLLKHLNTLYVNVEHAKSFLHDSSM